MSNTSTDSMDQESSKDNAENAKKPGHFECMRILNLVLDNEANEEELAVFKNHLENCLPYFEIYHVDQAIRKMLKKNCKDKKMPQELKEEIRAKIFKTAE